MLSPRPACPRCGYDLSGHADFDTLCPLGDTCPECGYRFLWRDVLNERYRARPGFYEHVPIGRSSVPAAARTLGMALLVFPFWRRVGVHHRVRTWPLLVLALALVVGGRAALLLADVSMAVAGQVLDEQRATVFTAAGRGPVFPGGTLTERLDHALTMPVPDHHGWDVEPIIYINRFLGESFAAATDPIRARWAALWFTFAWPAALLLMPFTLRKARVRPRLILRAFVFSLAPLVVFFSAHGLHSAAELLTDFALWRYPSLRLWAPRALYVTTGLVLWAPLAYAVWLYLWWPAAIRIGWKLRDGFFADALLALVVTLSWPPAYAAFRVLFT